MLDILVALGFAGSIWGIARVAGRHPDFRRVAGWTATLMFVIVSLGELSIAASGEATPSVGRVIPILILAIVMFRIGRDTESDDPAPDVLEPQVVSQ